MEEIEKLKKAAEKSAEKRRRQEAKAVEEQLAEQSVSELQETDGLQREGAETLVRATAHAIPKKVAVSQIEGASCAPLHAEKPSPFRKFMDPAHDDNVYFPIIVDIILRDMSRMRKSIEETKDNEVLEVDQVISTDLTNVCLTLLRIFWYEICLKGSPNDFWKKMVPLKFPSGKKMPKRLWPSMNWLRLGMMIQNYPEDVGLLKTRYDWGIALSDVIVEDISFSMTTAWFETVNLLATPEKQRVPQLRAFHRRKDYIQRFLRAEVLKVVEVFAYRNKWPLSAQLKEKPLVYIDGVTVPYEGKIAESQIEKILFTTQTIQTMEAVDRKEYGAVDPRQDPSSMVDQDQSPAPDQDQAPSAPVDDEQHDTPGQEEQPSESETDSDEGSPERPEYEPLPTASETTETDRTTGVDPEAEVFITAQLLDQVKGVKKRKRLSQVVVCHSKECKSANASVKIGDLWEVYPQAGYALGHHNGDCVEALKSAGIPIAMKDEEVREMVAKK